MTQLTTKQVFVIIIFICVVISGCAPAFRANPFLNERIQTTKVIAVMPMDVEVYKVSAGGVRELIDEYAEEATNNIKSSLEEKFEESRRYHIKYFPKLEDIEDPAIKQLFKDTIAIFKAVNLSIMLHTYYNPYMVMTQENPKIIFSQRGIFPGKIKNFDYSLGTQVSPLSEYVKADLFLFIKGGDFLSSGGRVALMVWATIMGFTPRSAGPPHLSAALADPKTGDILWYNFLCPETGYNFRNEESVDRFIKILLKDFPEK